MVDKVRFAVSTEEMRLQLQGALLKTKGGLVEMVATDGHRLALVEVEGAKAEAGFEPVLVSKKILDELGKLDAADDAPVTIMRGTNHIGFSVGSRRLFSKLDERRFPDYEKVISKENDKKAVVPREELLGAVRRIALLSGDRMKAVSLAFQKDALIVSSESQEVGDGSQEIVIAYDNAAVTLRLNARYLEQFLEAAETKDVHLFVKDEQAQCQGRPAEPLGGIRSYLYVVMPMRM
jgi:DNA polymerase-3 subunit beta